MGDKFHLKLNINEIPIAYKYREGKMKRTLKRELKGTEIAEREVESFNGLVKFLYVLWIFLICNACDRDFAVTLEVIVQTD